MIKFLINKYKLHKRYLKRVEILKDLGYYLTLSQKYYREHYGWITKFQIQTLSDIEFRKLISNDYSK